MKALAKYLPGKRLTMIQCLTTLLLVIIICCVSFGTIFSVTLRVDTDTHDVIENILDHLSDGPVEAEIPEQVDVNLIFLVKSIGAAIDTITSLISGKSEKDGIDSVIEDYENIQNNKDKIVSQDTVNFAAFVGAIYQGLQKNLIVGACYLLLIIMAFTFPITCLIKGIIALIGFFCHFTTDWGKAFHKVSKAIFGAISLFPVLLLLMILVPEVQFGWAIYSVLWLCVAALILNLAASRLKYYEGQDFKYLNILQIVSACSFGAFLMFFFGIAESNVTSALWDGIASLEISSINDIIQNILTVLLVLVFVSMLTRILNFMPKSVTRLACMSKNKSDTYIPSTVMGLISLLALYLLTKTDFELNLGNGKTSFIVALVGVVLMFAAEIVLKVLPAKLCPEVSAERRKEIVTGAYFCDFPAEEAPAEEAPAEDTPAEDASAEELSTEEVTE